MITSSMNGEPKEHKGRYLNIVSEVEPNRKLVYNKASHTVHDKKASQTVHDKKESHTVHDKKDSFKVQLNSAAPVKFQSSVKASVKNQITSKSISPSGFKRRRRKRFKSH